MHIHLKWVQSYPFFSKNNIHPKDSEEILADIEKNKIIIDLQSTKPQSEYKIPQTGEYAVIKLETKVPIATARRMAKEEVAEKTKVNYDDVQIIDKAFSSIYVPKWVINIESQDRIYAREILGIFYITSGWNCILSKRVFCKSLW